MERRRFLQMVAAGLPAASLAGCPRRQAALPQLEEVVQRDSGPGLVLNAGEWETLAAVCARLIPSDEQAGASEANVVNYIDSQLTAPHISGFKREILSGLQALDELAARSGGGGGRFASLPANEQDEALRQLQRARLGRGSGQHFLLVLLTLALEGFLGDPLYGGNRQEAGWRAIGFTPRPPRPRRPYRGREEALLLRHQAPFGKEVARGGRVDAVIIGSGAGGAPVALGLARAGYKVVVLEKGPAYDQRDFVNDEIAHCRRDFFVPYPSVEPHVVVDRQGRPQRTTRGWTSSCVGGATVHMSGFTYRLHPEDLKLRSLLGEMAGAELADWPLAWEELLPYYERIEHELGVSGDAAKNPFEHFRRPLPLPPLPENGFAQLIDQACGRLGWHSYPTARSIPSRPWQGRSRCQLSFFCGSYGCEMGAKSSTLAAILPKAVATGNCQVRPLCMVHTVELDERGRAAGVRYIDARGDEQRLAAAVVVLACSPLETARLLLHSRSKGHPDGLANDSGLVGRNLMFCGYAAGLGEFERSKPQIEAIDWRQPFVHRSLQDWYFIDRGSSARRKGGTLNYLLPHANPIANAERHLLTGAHPIWGSELKATLRQLYHEVRELEFEVFAETLPTAESRVELDPQLKDRWGLPAARIQETLHPADRESQSYLLERGFEVLREMGAGRTSTTQLHTTTAWLQAGTCRFGDDPRRSVLDRDCRAHSVPNLFVTDGSFMPTSGGVPNTLTVEANALRVADRIVALGKAQALFRKRS